MTDQNDFKIPVEKPKPLVATGKYKLVVAGSEVRTDPYLYYDIVFNVLGVPGATEVPQLKLGYSAKSINSSTELGQLVMLFQPLKREGESYTKAELDNIFLASTWEASVVDSPSKKNPQISYSNIVKTTLKRV